MKKYFMIWAIIGFPYWCLGQQYWERTYPPFGGDSEQPTCMTQSSSGDLWMVVRDHNFNGWSEILVHLDSSGQLIKVHPVPLDSAVDYVETSQILRLSDSSMLLVGRAEDGNFDKGYLKKIQADGTASWSFNPLITGDTILEAFKQVVELSDGRVLAVGLLVKSGVYLGPALAQFDQGGNMLGILPVHDPQDSIFPESLHSAILTPEGNSLLIFDLKQGQSTKTLLAFTDSTGHVLSTDTLDTYYVNAAVSQDGNYAVISTIYDAVTTARQVWLSKYDTQGQLLWSKTSELPFHVQEVSHFTANAGQGYSALFYNYQDQVANPFPRRQRNFARFSDTGELQHFSAVYWPGVFYPGALLPAADGGVYGMGQFYEYSSPYVLYRSYAFHLDSFGYSNPNRLEGRIVFDQNLSCAAEADEKGLEGFMVRLNRPGEEPLYARSDWDGNFEMEVDMGPYTLEVFEPGAQWKACSAVWPISFATRYDTLAIAIPVQAVTEHPVIETEAVLSSLKRCASNTVDIVYSNRSALASDSVQLWVALDPAMTFLSADFAPLSILGDTLLFQLPELPANETRRLKIKFQLECSASVSGQTHGISAWTETPVLIPAWAGADLQVKTDCLLDSTVQIEISNTGTGGAPQPLPYQVIHNDAIWLSSVLPVAPGAQASSSFPADGGYWYVAIRQPDGHPWLRYAAAGLEGCGGNASPGSLLQWSAQDDAPFAARENWPEGTTVAPNDIVAAPAGMGIDHNIRATDDLEYTIFFRNQTEYVSYYPYILDSLSRWLDLSTLRITASTLPCQLTFEANNVVRFHFSGEQIQPEFLNPKASGGYVRFRIKPFADTPAGTVIRTSSVFWPNLYKPLYPVSDQTTHQIGVSIPVSVATPESKDSGIELAPNPATTFTQIRLADGNLRQNRLLLRNSAGQVIFQTDFSGPQYRLQRSMAWPDGIYFIEIQTDAGRRSTCKLFFVSH